MKFPSVIQRTGPWLVLVALLSLGAGTAAAQSEPTLNQVYATAQAGKLSEAQVMIQQVLIGHPKSAKAHFVRAELYARQGDLEHARESLATAESLSPGLPFAKPEAVQSLRAQVSARSAPKLGGGVNNSRLSAPDTAVMAAATPASSSPSWGIPLVLAAAVIAAGYFIFRRRDPVPAPQPVAFGGSSGLSGPQTFGMGSGGVPAGYPPAGGYAQPPATGLGGRIMGGVATGLAVGAGVMAAEAIGRTLMGGHHNAETGRSDNLSNNDYQPIANTNPDMGGADFGINDAGSWDDGGGVSGGDWDN